MTTCDRCGTPCDDRGWLAINKDGRELTLCHVHRRDHQDALMKQGWALIELAVLRETEPSKSGEPDGVHSTEG